MQLEHTGEQIAGFGAESSQQGWLAMWQRRLMNSEDILIKDAQLFGRPLRVQLTPRAMHAAVALQSPLTVEVELYFSCMIRKAVRFRHAAPDSSLPPGSHSSLLEHLTLQFRPVTTQHCQLEAGAGAPPMETMPVTRPQAFVPRWVSIDFHHGDWLGEFGY